MFQSLKLSFLICSLALLLSSCAKKDEQQNETSTNFLNGIGLIPQNNILNRAPKYTQPTIDVLKGKLQQFPSEYPLVQYPNSKMYVADVRPNYTEQHPNYVILKTNDPITNVALYYKQKLAAEGWKPLDAYENTAYSTTSWQKGKQKAEIRVCPSPQPGERVIQLLIYPAS